MNLLFVADGRMDEPSSGTEQVVNQQATGMAGQGHRVFALARGTGDEMFMFHRIGAVREAVFGAPVKRPVAFMARLAICAPKALRRLIGNHSIDAVIAHQPSLLITLKALGCLRGIPIIYVFHSPWHKEYLLKHCRFSFGIATGAWGRRMAETLALRMACRIVVLSDYMCDQVRQVHGAPANKAVVIPGGVDLERFQPVTHRPSLQKRLGMPPRRRHFLTVRNLEARMGLDQLLIAFAALKRRHNDLHLTIGGEGPMKRELETLASTLGLGDSVTFTGFIPAGLLPKYYAAADLFVLPTRSLEGFGLVTVEALSCGTPVLGTPVGGTREILVGLGKNHLFEDISSSAMADGIDRFLNQYDLGGQAYENLRARCRRYVVESYGWKRHQDRLRRLVLDIASPVPAV